MTIRTATPYLILNGRARQAIEFYGTALGAKAEQVQRFGDVMQSCPEAVRDNVMHAVLLFGQTSLMLSDGPGEGALPATGVVHIALDLNDEAEARRAFAALSSEGKVVEPLFDAPWGALFGVVQDRFNVSWMFNCAKSNT